MREGKEIGALWKPGRGGIGVLQDERGFDTPGFVVECIPCVGCGNVGHWKSRMGRRVQGTRGGTGWWRVADMRADFVIAQRRVTCLTVSVYYSCPDGMLPYTERNIT